MDLDKETLITILRDLSTTCTGLPEETLARYAEIQRAGRRPEEEMPEVGAHLQECPDCAAQYDELLALLQAEAGGEVPALSSSRPFDLSFLPADKPGVWTSVRQDLRRLVAEIPLLIRRPAATFGPLAGALAPRRFGLATGALRGPAELGAEVERLELPDQEANLLFVLIPGPVEEQGERLTVVVQVQALDSGHPLRHIWVNLHDDQDRLLHSQTTQADGRVTFRGPAGDYVLRCKHSGGTWEFPLCLRAGSEDALPRSDDDT